MSKKVEQSVYRYATELVYEKGYVSPVDLLIKMEWLTLKQVEQWRFKRVSDLERVTKGNLSELNYMFMLKTLKKFAKEQQFKPSITVYKSWGKGQNKLLQFSKTGNPQMEELYATHYIRPKK